MRRRDGEIHTEAHDVVERWPRLRQTFLRGPVGLIDAVSTGWRASSIALRESMGVERDEGSSVAVAIPVLAVVLGVFVVLPAGIASLWSGVAADVAESVMRAGVLLAYLWGIGRAAFVQRLFMYHGAEHMTIAACERVGRIPSMDEARRESPVHVRCGTDFVALFVIASGVVFSFVTRGPIWLGSLLRLALVPVVVECAYELMRAAARYERSIPARVLTWPGRALQRITTRVPDEGQLEVALAALVTALS